MSKVLVTGGSGFVAVHCILQLLEAGHEVRATVRNLNREGEVRAMLGQGGWSGPGEALTFAAADLEADAGWADAVAGCDYVLHVASPFPSSLPKHPDDLIRPAREGALRVLRASRDAGVRRVVLTSSYAAIGYGHSDLAKPLDETDWTDLSHGDVAPYQTSKTLAERAAWNFIDEEGGELELAVVNPVGVFGPVLGPDLSTSIVLVQRLMEGSVPGLPRFSIGVVDVRDVADLHLRAMVDPAARGQRFLAVAGASMAAIDVARLLRARMGAAGERVPTRQLPDWAVRLVALVDPEVRQLVPELGKSRESSNEKARRLLGWTPRSNEEAILATAESLVRLGLLNPARKRAA
jgi:dihydroflavonol-4-reductase